MKPNHSTEAAWAVVATATMTHVPYPISLPLLFSLPPPFLSPQQHLRRRPNGALFLSHEVDLNRGTSREPQDFKEGPQDDFLEDHMFMMRTEHLPTIVDPKAAYTLEVGMPRGLLGLETLSNFVCVVDGVVLPKLVPVVVCVVDGVVAPKRVPVLCHAPDN